MWWNLDIFGKFALEIRMDYWYLWKTHFLNFREAHRPTLRGCGGAAPTIRGVWGAQPPTIRGCGGVSPHLSFVFPYRRDSTACARDISIPFVHEIRGKHNS